MTEPTTSNIGLIVPNTGDLSGAWGTSALNPNFSAIDGYVGGQLALTVSGATTITLTTASATLTPTAGPYQSANSIITISGSPTGTSFIQLTQPGVYRFLNSAISLSFPVVIQPATGGGNQVGLPPGELWHIGFNGTSCFYIGMPHTGAYMDLCAPNGTPPWINACTVAPWLFCGGATFNTANFPALAAYLGSTFGGNGITTFAVPDMQSRINLPIDFSGSGRVTSGGSGINGGGMGSNGGNQSLQQHQHANTISDGGHNHGLSVEFQPLGGSGSPVNGSPLQSGFSTVPAQTVNFNFANIGINNANAGAGGSQNMPPAIVGCLRYIKT